jgi:N-methylhydantoinase A
MSYVLGVDVGGTFTDAVGMSASGALVSAKTPSTPPDYSVGVMQALELLAEEFKLSLEQLLAATDHISHGTTASLNALVMRRVPPVGFLTTRGHGDSIHIMNVEGRYLGRPSHELQRVLAQAKPPPLVPRTLTFEISERIDRAGTILVPLDEAAVRLAVRECVARQVAGIAVSFLWSFRNSCHEQRVRDIIAEEAPKLYVALSSEVSPRIREFARNATTIMSAQIGPGLKAYLGALETSLQRSGLTGALLVMQSSGGAIAAAQAPESAITTIGSVLTGGVVAAMQLAQQLGHRNVITTDVGGTTFLAGLIVDGEPVRASNTIINQAPVNVPSLRVEAIGSGGGAIAWIDAGGNLRVGPLSAQAVPGPACYDAGGMEPTITDANLVLGILPAGGLLGGRRALSMARAREAIEQRIARPLNMRVEEAAAAIYAVQNAQTGDLLRKVVVEAGFDPREFAVYAFGGAGPAHCVAYAHEIRAAELVVPLGPVASAFSAYGLAASDVVITRELSDPGPLPLDPLRVAKSIDRLEQQVRDSIARQGLKFSTVHLHREVDMRYGVQAGEVAATIGEGPVTGALLEAAGADFEARYARMFGEGTGFREAGIHALTFRVRGVGVLQRALALPEIAAAESADASSALRERRPICLDYREGFISTAVYDYARLRAGHRIVGPCVIEVSTTTVVVPRGSAGVIDQYGNLRIQNP